MLEEYLAQSEGRTLEFKENTKNLPGIVKTAIAFANTAGGTIVIGVQDRTKEVIGVENVLKEEERLANALADNISPLLIPGIEIHSYRGKEMIFVHVPHAAGPYFLKSEGDDQGVYIRLGSTNRRADIETRLALRRFAANISYDETAVPKGEINRLLLDTVFGWVKKRPTDKNCETLGIFTSHEGKICPTVGGMLLFGSKRIDHLPDSIIRCGRFLGVHRERIIDHQDIVVPLPLAIDEIIAFIERNTSVEAKFGRMLREDVPQYPPFAIREAVINALLHADYSMTGCHIQIAIFDDRIEFTNPGNLPFGQTLRQAVLGFSRLRNRVLGRVLRELNLIEQWGSGLRRIFSVCERQGLKKPEIDDSGNQLRLTLFSTRVEKTKLYPWEKALLSKFMDAHSISPKEAAKIWNVSDRTARQRLKIMLEEGVVQRIATSEKDPRTVFILKETAY